MHAKAGEARRVVRLRHHVVLVQVAVLLRREVLEDEPPVQAANALVGLVVARPCAGPAILRVTRNAHPAVDLLDLTRKPT